MKNTFFQNWLKTLSIALLLLFSFSYIEAQIKLGVQASPQLTWMRADSKGADGGSPKFGFNIGLIFENYFATHYAFQSGISILSTGAQASYNGPVDFTINGTKVTVPPLTKINYKLQYIEIPLGLKFKTSEIGYTSYFANLGFMLQTNIKARATDALKMIDNEIIKKDIRLFNIGYYFGGGIEYNIAGSTKLISGINWINGFTDITETNKGKVTLGMLQLKIGVIF